MCIGFWSLDDPVYSLILCANRDEFLARPTLPARFHNFDVKPGLSKDEVENSSEEEGYVLSGIDLELGGTWVGINRTGQIGFLTNITEVQDETKYTVSRGSFAQHYLACSHPVSIPPLQYLREHYDEEKTRLKTAGFNFVLFSPKSSASPHLEYETALLTNHGARGPLEYRSIPVPDDCLCEGVSNAVDNSPVDGLGRTGRWLKLDVGRAIFDGILSARKTLEFQQTDDDEEQELTLVEDLMELMGWTPSSYEQSQHNLRDSIFIPPFPIIPHFKARIPSSSDGTAEPAKPLSLPVRKNGLYGTRLTTVILVRRDGRVCFVERDRSAFRGDGGPADTVEVFGPRGKSETQRLHRFHLQQSTPAKH